MRSKFFAALLSLGSLFVFLNGCAEAPIKVGDNNVEKPLQQVTGLTTEDVQKADQKTSLNLWDVFALAAKHTETLASGAENVEQAKAQNRQALGAWLPQVYLNDAFAGQSTNYITGSDSSLVAPPDNSLYLSSSETIFSGLTQ